jgi:methylated-DNA-[protein]-cysteine S-methyltransferase
VSIERELAGLGARPVEHEAAAARLVERALAEGAVDVAYAATDSPVGRLVLAATPLGLVRVAYADGGEDAVLAELAARLSPRLLRAPRRLDEARRELDEYFAGRRRAFELRTDDALVGPFARRVLRETARIPYGEHRSYGDVARAIGAPRASRATGNALGSNPIPIVVPCHRVLRGDGSVGGYTGGSERKRTLLALEGHPAQTPR